MQIGRLAALTKTPVDTIRYYEKIGLLPTPARTSGNYPEYTAREVDRLRFVRRCRRLDFPLEGTRRLIAFCDQPDRRCDEVNLLLDKHIAALERRRGDLETLANELRQLRAVCRAPGKANRCHILKTLRE
jgi:DNA-binding transcriptional MerR regulator